MSEMVEMVRQSQEAGGRDRFSVTREAWALLYDLGRAFGWQPSGTQYLRESPAKGSPSATHDYRPGDYRDYKIVEADDANAWAAALDKARHSPHLVTMIGQRPGNVTLSGDVSAAEARSANAPFDVTMKEFIQYAYGGAFSFALAK